MSGRNIYFSQKELKALRVIFGTYLNISGVDFAVLEEHKSIENEFNTIYDKIYFLNRNKGAKNEHPKK